MRAQAAQSAPGPDRWQALTNFAAKELEEKLPENTAFGVTVFDTSDGRFQAGFNSNVDLGELPPLLFEIASAIIQERAKGEMAHHYRRCQMANAMQQGAKEVNQLALLVESFLKLFEVPDEKRDRYTAMTIARMYRAFESIGLPVSDELVSFYREQIKS